MESQPQNPDFRINPKNFHPCFKCSSFFFTLFILELVMDSLFKITIQLSVNNCKALNQLAINCTIGLHIHTEHTVCFIFRTLRLKKKLNRL